MDGTGVVLRIHAHEIAGLTGQRRKGIARFGLCALHPGAFRVGKGVKVGRRLLRGRVGRIPADVALKAGDFKLIPLGIAMQLPKGYEAHIIPRSSTFKNFGVIQANHMGMVDESYCGDNDQWFFPAIALRDTTIKAGDRICQFRIEKHQPQLFFESVDTLGNADRGGIGSTGKR